VNPWATPGPGIHIPLQVGRTIVTKVDCLTRVVIVSTMLIYSSVSLHGQAPQPGEPDEQLHSFSPNEADALIEGAPLSITATATLIPSLSEAVEFTSSITLKKHRFRPFVTVLTQRTAGSGVTGSEVMTWTTRVPGPKRITIRLQLTGVGESSGRKFTFADLTRTYSVQCNPKECWLLRRLRHIFGCCSK
jgi:hypothetical protein